MPDITYSLGGISFDAVPRKGSRELHIPAASRVTIGRKRLLSTSVPGERLVLAGDYLTETTRAQLESLIDQTESDGTLHVFDDGVAQRNAIIESFTYEAIIGISENAYSFEMRLLLLGEA
jgi:hypothetical protein